MLPHSFKKYILTKNIHRVLGVKISYFQAPNIVSRFCIGKRVIPIRK